MHTQFENHEGWSKMLYTVLLVFFFSSVKSELRLYVQISPDPMFAATSSLVRWIYPPFLWPNGELRCSRQVWPCL